MWGWTFVVVRDAVSAYPVLPFLALRFALAGLLLAPTLLTRGSGVAAGIVPGTVLAIGYLCQTVGLQFTTASRAGLLTGLFVVFTPVLLFAVHRRAPPLYTALATCGALGGTVLLTGFAGGSRLSGRELTGDALEVMTALCFAVHIVLLSRFGVRVNASKVAWSQMTAATLIFGLGSAIRGGVPSPSLPVLAAIVVTGALASAAAFWVQTYVQQRISPARTALILTAEPAFATLFGLLLAGDRFGLAQGAGACLILISLTGHEVRAIQTASSPQSAET